MPKKHHISACVDADFYEQVKLYCRKNQMSIASLIGVAVSSHINNEWELELLSKCERLIDAKLPPTFVEVTARKV